MSARHRWLRRALLSARAWRRNRMIERRASLGADEAGDAVGSTRPPAVEPRAMRLPAPATVASPPHVLVTAEAALHGRRGRWVV